MNKVPHCPLCNIDLKERVTDFPIELPLLGVINPAPTLFVCQNPDDICGYFVILGRKMVTSESQGELEV